MANLLLGVSAFLLSLNAAFAITCYSCDSSKGSSCNYGLLAFTYSTIDCNVSPSNNQFLDSIGSIFPKKCYKLVGVDKEDNEYVARGCIPSTGPFDTCAALAKTLQFLESGSVKKLECSTCDTDKCNSASRFAVTTVASVLLACLIFLF